jgi:hypothetical protein
MRVMGFSVKWHKLYQPVFTTFRLPRKDKDWHTGERVQIVYHPRCKDHEKLGEAVIVNVEARSFNPAMAPKITDDEAVVDGFDNANAMRVWLQNAHGHFNTSTIFNKVTLRPFIAGLTVEEIKALNGGK